MDTEITEYPPGFSGIKQEVLDDYGPEELLATSEEPTPVLHEEVASAPLLYNEQVLAPILHSEAPRLLQFFPEQDQQEIVSPTEEYAPLQLPPQLIPRNLPLNKDKVVILALYGNSPAGNNLVGHGSTLAQNSMTHTISQLNSTNSCAQYTFVCPKCFAMFEDWDLYSFHCKNKLHCNLCHLVFDTLTDLEMHLDLTHQNIRPVVRLMTANIKSEMLVAPVKELPHCILCYKQFNTAFALNRHLRSFHVITTIKSFANFLYFCGLCSKSFATVRATQRHNLRCTQSVHGLNSPLRFSDNITLKYTCKVCHQGLSSRRRAERHMMTEHCTENLDVSDSEPESDLENSPGGQASVICRLCGVNCGSYEFLHHHLSENHRVGPYKKRHAKKVLVTTAQKSGRTGAKGRAKVAPSHPKIATTKLKSKAIKVTISKNLFSSAKTVQATKTWAVKKVTKAAARKKKAVLPVLKPPARQSLKKTSKDEGNLLPEPDETIAIPSTDFTPLPAAEPSNKKTAKQICNKAIKKTRVKLPVLKKKFPAVKRVPPTESPPEKSVEKKKEASKKKDYENISSTPATLEDCESSRRRKPVSYRVANTDSESEGASAIGDDEYQVDVAAASSSSETSSSSDEDADATEEPRNKKKKTPKKNQDESFVPAEKIGKKKRFSDIQVIHWLCNLCNTHCTSAIDLLEHCQAQHQDATHFKIKRNRSVPSTTFVRYHCDDCRRKFHALTDLIGHKLRHVQNLRPMPCRFCPEIFTDTTRLDHHYIKEHCEEAKKLKESGDHLICPQCSEKFDTIFTLRCHFVSHFVEPDNSKLVLSISDKLKHYSLAREATYVYRVYLNTKTGVHEFLEKPPIKTKHILKRSVSGICDIYHCSVCNIEFDSWARIYIHCHTIHGDKFYVMRTSSNKNGSYQCDECGHFLRTLFTLHNHKIRHRGVKPFQCRFCRRNFITDSAIMLHYSRDHVVEYKALVAQQYRGIPISNAPTVTELEEKQPANPENIPTENSNISDTAQASSTFKDLGNIDLNFKSLTEDLENDIGIETFGEPQQMQPERSIQHHAVSNTSELPCSSFAEGTVPLHTVNSSGMKKYIMVCNLCNLKFKKAIEVYIHATTVHADIKEKLPQAVRNDLPKGKHQCNECHACFSHIRVLQQHIIRHRGVKHVGCTKCNLSFYRYHQQQMHMKKMHPKPLTDFDKICRCKQCEERRKKWDDGDATAVESETNKRTIPKQELHYSCKYCSKVFIKKLRRTLHYRKEHKREFVCNDCGDKYNNRRTLVEHLKSHCHLEFPCSRCNTTYNTYKDWFKHVCKDDKGKCFVCTHCTRTFNRHYRLQRHRLKHRTNPQCDICGRSFSNQKCLENHQKVFHSEKTFLCPKCGASFALVAQLKQHIKRHEEEKFQCPKCPRKFLSRFEMQSHKNTHKERHYICHICNRVLGSKQTYSIHMSRHEGAMNYSCKICNKRYSAYNSVKYHMQAIHNITVGVGMPGFEEGLYSPLHPGSITLLKQGKNT